MIGVYKIRNIINNKCYIGSSIVIEERWKRHKKDLRSNKHHSIVLQRAYNKYGIDSFEFSIVELTDNCKCIEREQYYLELLEPVYNIARFAGAPTKGMKMSKESSDKKRKYALDNNIIPPKETWENRQKSVIQLDKETLEELNTFSSVAEACRYVGKDHTWVTCVSNVCNGIRGTTLGYKWKWEKG